MLDSAPSRGDDHGQQVRSTWLTASRDGLRRNGYFARYELLLAAPDRAALDAAIAGMWLPAELAYAHYTACEGLMLNAQEATAMGTEVGAFAHRTFISYAIQLAKGAGVTPWTVIDALPKLWGRCWQGAAVEVQKVGPKDALISVRDWPLAGFNYIRLGTRGILLSLTSPVASKVYVSEHEKACTQRSLGFRVAWV